MNKLQRIEEMEKQLAALRAEVEQEADLHGGIVTPVYLYSGVTK